jgi:hypothetical protein
MPEQAHVIVVRCSMLDGYDPIGEIDKLVRSRKKAWFGKYGQPLGPQLKQTLNTGEREVFALLIRKGSPEEGGEHIFKVYRLLDVAVEQTPSKGWYPSYYVSFLGRIRSWILLAPYDGPQITLDDLVTRSSGLPLRKSLARSMKGHFLAVLRKRDNV